MTYSIDNGPVFTTLTFQLVEGESVLAESGAMISMSTSIDLKAEGSGKGVFGVLKSASSGEGFFNSRFTAVGAGGEVVLAPSVPGAIIAIPLKGETVSAKSGSFFAGSVDLNLSVEGSLKGMVSGKGLFLQKISGQGDVFLNTYGAVLEKTLTSEEEYIIDNGHLVAFDETVNYTFKKSAKGIFSSLASGEGYVCVFKGPGRVWTQTRNLRSFAGLLSPYIKSN